MTGDAALFTLTRINVAMGAGGLLHSDYTIHPIPIEVRYLHLPLTTL